MADATGFGVQSWLITPAAGVGNRPPPTIQNQKWLLVLSGVAVIDLKGIKANDWSKEVVSILPDLTAPLQHTIAGYGIPTPTGPFFETFEVDLMAPFGAPSSIFNPGRSVHAGYAVDAWRPNPFSTATNAFTGTKMTRLFAGIQLDVGVRDKEALVYRVGYNITLLGKIVFGNVIP